MPHKEETWPLRRLSLKPEYFGAIRWSARGSCGEPGCRDPECCCAFCREPIGVSEDDPRWEKHDEDCYECELCVDRVPLMLFRGQGKQTEQAQFHKLCFEKIVHIRSKAG
jgi:hypothetical protein